MTTIELTGLRGRLAGAAERTGVLDVAYRTVDTRIGPLLLAATPAGVVRIAFAGEGFDAVLQDLADRVSPRLLAAPARLDAAARQIEEYLAGHRRVFALPLDRRLSRGFRRTVLERLAAEIGYGRTESYRGLAARAGNPGAARAVGTACATNPIPIVVPCHRILRADGAPGGYRGGPEVKRTLLDLEAVG